MNSEIKIMVDLQGYWDAILASRQNIEKSGATLRDMERELEQSNKKLATASAFLKDLKKSLKQHELQMKEMEARIVRLEERKKMIHTEKELHAIEKEIDVIKFDIGTHEDAGLGLIDEIDEKEKEYAQLQNSAAAIEDKIDTERPKLAEKITKYEDTIAVNRARFDELQGSLAAAYRSKFIILLNARDGKGVARVNGEICGQCNFKIPSFLAIEATKDDRVVTCTNCGKYIYKEQTGGPV